MVCLVICIGCLFLLVEDDLSPAEMVLAGGLI